MLDIHQMFRSWEKCGSSNQNKNCEYASTHAICSSRNRYEGMVDGDWMLDFDGEKRDLPTLVKHLIDVVRSQAEEISILKKHIRSVGADQEKLRLDTEINLTTLMQDVAQAHENFVAQQREKVSQIDAALHNLVLNQKELVEGEGK